MTENNRQASEGPFQRQYTQSNEPQPKKPEPATSKNSMGEYIDFEEIK